MIFYKSYYSNEGREYFHIFCVDPGMAFEMGSKSSNRNAELLQMDFIEFCEILEKCGAMCKKLESGRTFHTFDNLEDVEKAIDILEPYLVMNKLLGE